MDKKLVGLAGTIVLALSGWIASTVYQLSIDTAIIKNKLEKVYDENCPYCVHSAHSFIKDHPLLSPTIRHAHQHVGKRGDVIPVN